MMAMGSSFEQLAGSMKEFSSVVSELKRGGEWEGALSMMNLREATMQEQHKVSVQD